MANLHGKRKTIVKVVVWILSILMCGSAATLLISLILTAAGN